MAYSGAFWTGLNCLTSRLDGAAQRVWSDASTKIPMIVSVPDFCRRFGHVSRRLRLSVEFGFVLMHLMMGLHVSFFFVRPNVFYIITHLHDGFSSLRARLALGIGIGLVLGGSPSGHFKLQVGSWESGVGTGDVTGFAGLHNLIVILRFVI